MSTVEIANIASDILSSPYTAKILSIIAKKKKPLSESEIKTQIDNIDPVVLEDSMNELAKDYLIEKTPDNAYVMTNYGDKVYKSVKEIIKIIPTITRIVSTLH